MHSFFNPSHLIHFVCNFPWYILEILVGSLNQNIHKVLDEFKPLQYKPDHAVTTKWMKVPRDPILFGKLSKNICICNPFRKHHLFFLNNVFVFGYIPNVYMYLSSCWYLHSGMYVWFTEKDTHTHKHTSECTDWTHVTTRHAQTEVGQGYWLFSGQMGHVIQRGWFSCSFLVLLV